EPWVPSEDLSVSSERREREEGMSTGRRVRALHRTLRNRCFARRYPHLCRARWAWPSHRRAPSPASSLRDGPGPASALRGGSGPERFARRQDGVACVASVSRGTWLVSLAWPRVSSVSMAPTGLCGCGADRTLQSGGLSCE